MSESLQNLILHPTSLKATVELGDNGDGAKSAPVTIVANSGDPHGTFIPSLGAIVVCFDFDSMTVPSRIPLDYAHSVDDSIGYLNKFDITDGVLTCRGAVVMSDDDTLSLVARMRAGVPYQASVESHEFDLEMVPDGVTVTVNNREQVGPFFIVRNWKLAAVAVCKFGADANTETRLAAKRNNETIFFKRASIDKCMAEQTKPVVETPEVKPVVETVKPTDVKPETVETPETKNVVVEEPAKPETVDTQKPVEELPTKLAASVDAGKPTTADAVQVDPRAEFKRFVATFGDQSAEYFAAGFSFENATVKHMSHLQAENQNLAKRLAAVDRGANPIVFKDQSIKAKMDAGIEPVVRFKK